jgi:hypothetical protein
MDSKELMDFMVEVKEPEAKMVSQERVVFLEDQ